MCRRRPAVLPVHGTMPLLLLGRYTITYIFSIRVLPVPAIILPVRSAGSYRQYSGPLLYMKLFLDFIRKRVNVMEKRVQYMYYPSSCKAPLNVDRRAGYANLL